MKKQFLLTILFVVSLLVSACAGNAQAAPTTEITSNADQSPGIVAEGILLPGEHIALAFANGGRALEVNVSEGERVRAGQVLARLEGSEALQAQRAAADLELVAVHQSQKDLDENTLQALALASADLETYIKVYDDAVRAWNGRNGSNPTVFDTTLVDYLEAEEAVRDAQKSVNDQADQPADAPTRLQAEKDLQREQTRRASAYIALLADYENPQEGSTTDKRTALLAAITLLETARQRLIDLSGGADPDQVEVLEARQKAAESARSAAEEGLRALEIRAPWDGVLSAWDLKVGEIVSPGSPVGALADLSSWYVETTDLTENGVVSIQPGDPVSIQLDALPGETFGGTIESIRGYGEQYQGDMTYTVRIRLDQIDQRWYWNMSATVTISPGQ